MKNNIHIHSAQQRVLTSGIAIAMLVSVLIPGTALAASTWNPTLLVNTESFQTLDEGDGTTNIEIRFGQTLNEKLFYDRTNSRFVFSRSLRVSGQLSTTGSAIINIGSNTAAAPDTGIALEVIGTASGINFFATKQLQSSGSLAIEGDAGIDDTTFHVDAANNKVGIGASKDLNAALEIIGTASGVDIFAAKSISGANLYAASTFGGAGLTDCDTAGSSKLLWNADTKQFTCGTDQNSGSFGTGNVITIGDSRYVNTAGDTMTGALRISNNAGLNASGSILTNTNVTINSDNGAVDAVLTFGNATAAQSITFANATQRFDFAKEIHTASNVTASGTLTVDGNAKTKADLSINSDNGAVDAVLTFGSDGTAETATFKNLEDRFEFSDDVHTTGNLTATGTITADGAIRTKSSIRAATSISGSTLTVDGNITIKSQTYVFPTNVGTAGSVLKNNGSNTLSWSTSINNSSGGVMTLHPEYPGATYFASGSTAVGSMTYSYDATNKENFYRWGTTRSSLQDYWTSVRVMVPKGYSHFETASGILLRLRTTSTSASNNYITLRLLDTTGAEVAIGNNAQLVSSTAATWITKTITNVTSGTFTPGGYITILVKTAALTANDTDLGSIMLNWATTTP